jgi:hypothetical protein
MKKGFYRVGVAAEMERLSGLRNLRHPFLEAPVKCYSLKHVRARPLLASIHVACRVVGRDAQILSTIIERVMIDVIAVTLVSSSKAKDSSMQEFGRPLAIRQPNVASRVIRARVWDIARTPPDLA